jgi:ribosomal-protein-alanine N-acetyltransferase
VGVDGVVIRKATVEDLPILLELERMCFKRGRYSEDQIDFFLRGENEETFLYLDENDAVGSVMLSSRGPKGKVVSIGVRPDWRKKGVAKDLMKIAEEWFVDSGAEEVDLEVGTSNREALNMYTGLGYEVVKVLKDYYHGKEDAYLMRKEFE